MKKLFATFCLALGFASASFAATPTVNPVSESQIVKSAQMQSREVIVIVIEDDDDVIIIIINRP